VVVDKADPDKVAEGEPEVSLSIIQPKVPAAVGGGSAPAELEAGSGAPEIVEGDAEEA
jgi:hypothetical protein